MIFDLGGIIRHYEKQRKNALNLGPNQCTLKVRKEMFEKQKCPLPPKVQIPKELHAYIQWIIHSLVATTVLNLVIIKQIVRKILSGQS